MRPTPAEYESGATERGERATLVRMSLPQRLLRVVPLVLAGALLCWAATLNNGSECGDIGTCLGQAFDDVLVLVIAVPGVAIGLRVLHVPRVLLHTLASLAVGLPLWVAAGETLRALDPERSYDAALPIWLVPAVAVLTAVAATYVVGPGRSTRALLLGRIAVPLVALACAFAAVVAADRTAAQHRIDELAAAPVTLYAPTIAGSGPRSAYASTDGVRMSYFPEVDGSSGYVSLELVPTPTGSLCEALVTIPSSDCIEDGETLRSTLEGGGGYAEVALVRGTTTLHADFDVDELDPDDVLRALRDAPLVSAEELARS
jgi:hypothetical protein